MVLLDPLAHQDHLDSQVQLARKDRREKRVLLVPEEIRVLLAPQDLQDRLQQSLSPFLSWKAGGRDEGTLNGQEEHLHLGMTI